MFWHKILSMTLWTFLFLLSKFFHSQEEDNWQIPSFNPNQSLDFHSASSLFRADCNVRVEAIAGYGETRTAARWRNKGGEGWKRKTNSFIIRLFRYNERFGFNHHRFLTNSLWQDLDSNFRVSFPKKLIIVVLHPYAIECTKPQNLSLGIGDNDIAFAVYSFSIFLIFSTSAILSEGITPALASSSRSVNSISLNSFLYWRYSFSASWYLPWRR